VRTKSPTAADGGKISGGNAVRVRLSDRCSRRFLPAVGILFAMLLGTPAAAQSTPPAAGPNSGPGQRSECPPGQSGQAPKLGETPPSGNLSNQLSQSHGVICPPAGVDPEMSNPPPGGGRTPVIPPPGTAPGDRTVPK
jgi:hypothetical protein